MNDTALIFGAGKTGRGFAAHLAFLGGYRIILVDENKQLIAELQKARQYDIQVLDAEEKSSTILLSGAYHIDDPLWHDEFINAHVIFTAVFGSNLEKLSEALATPLRKRHQQNPYQFLTIITCENLIAAAVFLRINVIKHLEQKIRPWLDNVVGFSESIIFRTCLDAAPGQPSLTVRSQNFFELPCDGDNLKEQLHVFGLKPMANFSNQLRRKIYTYNCINAVVAYLGAEKGYSQLHEAGNDENILAIARRAASETSRAQVAEFGFDPMEQEEWTNAAFQKFSDKNIPDPIERNAADPVRKLGRDDRLIGPALLALKHGIQPEGLITGIISCFNYSDPTIHQRVADLVNEKGVDYVLREICGLVEEEQLYMLIKQRINPNGKS